MSLYNFRVAQRIFIQLEIRFEFLWIATKVHTAFSENGEEQL